MDPTLCWRSGGPAGTLPSVACWPSSTMSSAGHGGSHINARRRRQRGERAVARRRAGRPRAKRQRAGHGPRAVRPSSFVFTRTTYGSYLRGRFTNPLLGAPAPPPTCSRPGLWRPFAANRLAGGGWLTISDPPGDRGKKTGGARAAARGGAPVQSACRCAGVATRRAAAGPDGSGARAGGRRRGGRRSGGHGALVAVRRARGPVCSAAAGYRAREV